MSENIQKGYIRIADIMPFQDDMRIADIPKLGEIAPHLRRSYEIKKDLNRMGNRSSGHFK